jgi:oligosaccharide repeat unit polymerase
LCSVGAILFAGLLWLDGAFDARVFAPLVCVALQIQMLWTLVSWKWIGRELFSPYGLFVIAVFVFNAGQSSLEILGLNHGGLLEGQFPERRIAETLLFVLYGLSLVHLGALVAGTQGAQRQRAASLQPKSVTLRRVAAAFFLVALIPSIMMWQRALALVSQGGYMAIYQADLATGFGAAPTVLSGFLVPSGFLLLAGSGRRRWLRLAACAIVGSYVLAHLLVGSRGYGIAVLAAFVWLWHRIVRRIPLVPVMAIGASIAVFILPVIGVTRMNSRQQMTLSQLAESWAGIDGPAVYTLHEMGSSMITSAYTIQMVPARHEYELGGSYAYALFSLVPNLFWSVHPAAEHSPSKWLVNNAEPERARVSGGLGYSVIAEAYLNFGWWGAGVPLALIGWAVGRLSMWADLSQATSGLCLAAILLSSLLIYARAETGEVIRGFAWYAAIPYLIVTYWPSADYRRRPEPDRASATISKGAAPA